MDRYGLRPRTTVSQLRYQGTQAMCVKPNPGEKVVTVRCQPNTYPCPTCGRRGHRKRRLDRFVRSLDYGRVLWLHVYYAEYTARCDCRKSFRSWVPNSCPKAQYDHLVRQAVLNRILDDGLNVERRSGGSTGADQQSCGALQPE